MNRRAWATGTILFLVALGVRLFYLVQYRADPLHDDLHQIFDSVYYHREGAAIALGDWTSSLPYYLSPLYSWFVGIVYAFAGTSTHDLKVAQAFLGAACCVLLYVIGRRIFSESVGLVAGATLALYGLLIYYTGIVLPAVFVLFLNLCFLLIMIGDENGERSVQRCFAGGVLAGLAAVAKSNALLLVPAAMVALWFTSGGESKRARALACTALALGAVLTVAPFTFRNYEVSGHFVLIGTTNGRNLWKGNGPHANGTHVHLPPDDVGIGLKQYLLGEVDADGAVADSQAFTRRTIEYVLENPARTAKLIAIKLALFFNAIELGVRDHYYFARDYSSLLRLPLPGFGLVGSLGIAGMLFAWRGARGQPRRRGAIAMVYAVLAVQVASFVAVFVLARYRLVAVACLTLFGSWLLVEAVRLARARRATPLIVGAATVALAAAVTHAPTGFSRDQGRANKNQYYADRLASDGRHAEAIPYYQRALETPWLDDRPAIGLRVLRLRLARAYAATGEGDRARAMAEQLLAETTGLARRPAVHAKIITFLRELDAAERQSPSGSADSGSR